MTAKRTHSRKKTRRAAIKVADLPPFDAATYLEDEQTIAAYLTDIGGAKSVCQQGITLRLVRAGASASRCPRQPLWPSTIWREHYLIRLLSIRLP